MNSLLDRYFLRRHIWCLALSIVALWAMALIIDLIENIDTFIDHDATFTQIGRYYLYRSPYWIVLALPITTLLGTLFSLAGFARRSEISAAKAAGVSLHRIFAPLHLFTLLFAGAAFLFTDWVVPTATFRYNTVKDEIRSYRRSDGSRRQVLLQDVQGQFVFARSYDHQRLRAHDVTWERTMGSHTLERASGRHLEWRESAGRWTMVDGQYHSLDSESIATATFDTLALSLLTLRPEDFARQQRKPEEMDYQSLMAYIARAQSRGEDVTRHIVDLHLKIAFPVTCIVIFVFGAPLAANAQRSSRATVFGLAVLICFLFYSGVKAGQALGWNEMLSPWLGAWIGNLIFGAVGLGLMRRAHT